MLPLTFTFLEKKYKPFRPRFLLKAPHTITLPGCLTVLTVTFGSYRDEVLARRTIFRTPLTNVKVLLSLNIIFLHSATIQCRYLLQKLSLFLYCWIKDRFLGCFFLGFLAARRHCKFRSYCSQRQMILVERCGETQGACFSIQRRLLVNMVLFHAFKSLTLLGEVFLGAPKPDFLFSTIPGGNDAANLFT